MKANNGDLNPGLKKDRRVRSITLQCFLSIDFTWILLFSWNNKKEGFSGCLISRLVTFFNQLPVRGIGVKVQYKMELKETRGWKRTVDRVP